MPPRVVKADLSRLISAVQAVLAAPHQLSTNGDVTTRGEAYAAFEIALWTLLRPYLIPPPLMVQRWPCIRVKEGKAAGGRFETSIIHTDAWSGNMSSVAMIPIEGDFERGGVEFYIATQNLPELLREHGDYKQAPNFAPRYVGKMEPGYIYFLDPSCLHKTMLGGKKRVSVDVRLAYQDLEFSRRRNYIEWK